jgi:hypothetical protein
MVSDSRAWTKSQNDPSVDETTRLIILSDMVVNIVS